jgi:hypothetical protein
MNSSTVISVVTSVTRKWTNQRKAEIRGKSKATRKRVMARSNRAILSRKPESFPALDSVHRHIVPRLRSTPFC